MPAARVRGYARGSLLSYAVTINRSKLFRLKLKSFKRYSPLPLLYLQKAISLSVSISFLESIVMEKALGLSPLPPPPSSPIPCKQRQRPLLPPSASPTKKTLILDLDHTLIHAALCQPSADDSYNFQVECSTELGVEEIYYVAKRPGVDMLLQKISKLDFEIVAFTAGTKEYASKILDAVDPEGLISHRLYRDSCKKMGRKYFKDLTDLGRDMNQVVAVDDHPEVYLFESRPIPDNVFPVSRFKGKRNHHLHHQDRQLQGVVQFLEFAASFTDTREAIRQYHTIKIKEDERPAMKKRRACDVVAVNGGGLRLRFKFTVY
ncbi:hypothetical protein ACLOJK_009395 [Asimina triloba]